MSVFKPVGKAAKFTFVTVPLSIFGWQLNKRLFVWVRSLWTHSTNPACPDCDEGVLLCQRNVEPVFGQAEMGEQRPRQLYPWVCNRCGYGLLESLDHQRVRAVTGRHRMERARGMFSDLEYQERQTIARKHQAASRIFFSAALLTFANGIYMLASGASLMATLNWSSFSFMFWVFGMKRSYRSWQMRSGHIFEHGSVRNWFKHEKWLI